MTRYLRRLFYSFLLLSFTSGALVCQLPDGFGIEPVVEGDEVFAGIRFLNDSISMLWSMEGRVFTKLNDEALSVILDITEEAGQWGEHGMLGFAVHPQFYENGYIFMLYAVDQYHLLHSEDPDYDPLQSESYRASVGRLARYQLEVDYPHSVIAGSRTVLIGSEIDNGIPQMSASHGVGSLEFGSDGSLLVSCGDGSTWVGAFTGGPPFPDFAYDEEAMALNILSEDQNLGSFRAQYVDSYNGKILRIDPLTGMGLDSNPFYDAEQPDAQRSKIWSLGLRNPYRFIPRPGTGSPLMSAGNPGTLFIGDVGYYRWEEINVADGPAINFGWPQYEGMSVSEDFGELFTNHPYYQNPISCAFSNYRFQDLIIESNADHIYSWPNPCDNTIFLADSIRKFVHERPAVAYSNQATPHQFDVITPSYDANGQPIGIPIEEIPGFSEPSFTGIACVGGDFYYGSSFPEEYFGAYFQSDYSGWLKVFWFDENNNLLDFKHISSSLGPIYSTRFNPYDECMYFVSGFPSTIYRMCYGGNVKPDAIIQADTLYGSSPLTVSLDAGNSSDADNDPLTYFWNFGDNTTSTSVSLSHTFIAPDNAPFSYTVSLLVTDTAGNSDVAELIIALNNTPPQVSITSLSDSSFYDTESTTIAPLVADVVDLEFTDAELLYEWQTLQHHNFHIHSNPYDNSHVTSTVFETAGCVDYATYYYSVSLRVTDPGGLSGFDEVRIFPDCDGTIDSIPRLDELILYPNPSTGILTVRGPLIEEGEYSIDVFDYFGRRVYSQPHRADQYGRIGFSLEFLAPGQYFIRLDGQGLTQSFPLLILK